MHQKRMPRVAALHKLNPDIHVFHALQRQLPDRSRVEVDIRALGYQRADVVGEVFSAVGVDGDGAGVLVEEAGHVVGEGGG